MSSHESLRELRITSALQTVSVLVFTATTGNPTKSGTTRSTLKTVHRTLLQLSSVPFSSTSFCLNSTISGCQKQISLYCFFNALKLNATGHEEQGVPAR